jgi:endonuclease-3 related protein
MAVGTIETGQKLMQIFNIMYEKLGPQNWWPADSPFEVVIGAILTQFVSWRNVGKAILGLKEKNLLSVEGICGVETSKLEEIIISTRFYKQKAKKLKAFCQHVKDKHGGSLERLFNQQIIALREELLSLYGIGEETADSIILYAAEMPIFVVDAYTRRIFSRLGFFDEKISYSKMQRFFMDSLKHDVQLFNEYHALIDAVGNRYCSTKKPDCGRCPLAGVCRYGTDLFAKNR